MTDRATRQATLVSVAIPAYNAADTLAETLRSVVSQTHQALDIVVIDDGSTDETAAVAESFGNRVRLVRQANRGIAWARNASLQAARGEFIALLDADDLCEPERIAVQLEYMLRNPHVLLCSSDFSGFDENGLLAASYCGEYYTRCSSAQGGSQARYPQFAELDITDCLGVAGNTAQLVRTLHGEVYEELTLGNFIHPPTVMLRREALRRAGLFDTEVRIVCEWEWFVRVAAQGPVGYIDRPLLRYRRSTTQISSNPLTALDSLRVAQLIHERDPELRARRPLAVRRHLGALSLSAAYALAETRRFQALRLLLASTLRYRTWRLGSLATLARLALPRPLRDGLNKWRRRLHRASPPPHAAP